MQRQQVAQRPRGGAREGLDRVGEGIEACRCREARWHAQGEQRVDEGGSGRKEDAAEPQLLVSCRVGHHGPEGDLAARASRGRDGDERGDGALDRSRLVEGEVVVGHLAAVREQDADGLRGVDDAAATDRDEHVAGLRGGEVAGGDDRAVAGVRLDGVEEGDGEAGGVEGVTDALDQAGLLDPRVGDHERARPAEFARALAGEAAAALPESHRRRQRELRRHTRDLVHLVPPAIPRRRGRGPRRTRLRPRPPDPRPLVRLVLCQSTAAPRYRP